MFYLNIEKQDDDQGREIWAFYTIQHGIKVWYHVHCEHNPSLAKAMPAPQVYVVAIARGIVIPQLPRPHLLQEIDPQGTYPSLAGADIMVRHFFQQQVQIAIEETGQVDGEVVALPRPGYPLVNTFRFNAGLAGLVQFPDSERFVLVYVDSKVRDLNGMMRTFPPIAELMPLAPSN